MSEPPPSSPPSQQEPQAPVPGWYQDPTGPGLRWWDGAAWTAHVRDPESTSTPAADAGGTIPVVTATVPAASGGPTASASSLRKLLNENARLVVLIAILVLVLLALLVI